MKQSTLIATLFTSMLLAAPMAAVHAQAQPQAAAGSTDDAAVTGSVKTALASFQQVNVSAAQGVVTLSGTVATKEQAAQAAQAAAAVAGVKEVKNNVKVGQ